MTIISLAINFKAVTLSEGLDLAKVSVPTILANNVTGLAPEREADLTDCAIPGEN